MIKQLLQRQRMWRAHELRSAYDVVIVGAGVHGLAAAKGVPNPAGVPGVR